MSYKIKGEIKEELITESGIERNAIVLETDTYDTLELSDDFQRYVGYHATIKLKHWTDVESKQSDY